MQVYNTSNCSGTRAFDIVSPASTCFNNPDNTSAFVTCGM